MTGMLGASLWMLFLLGALYAYRKDSARRMAEYRGLCRLIAHIAHTLAEIPVPLNEIYCRFTDEALARAGFLARLREAGLYAALSAGALRIEKERLAPFLIYAKDLGARLYGEERKAAERMSAEAERTLAAMSAEMPQKQKLACTLTATGGMLLLLLLL